MVEGSNHLLFLRSPLLLPHQLFLLRIYQPIDHALCAMVRHVLKGLAGRSSEKLGCRLPPLLLLLLQDFLVLLLEQLLLPSELLDDFLGVFCDEGFGRAVEVGIEFLFG